MASSSLLEMVIVALVYAGMVAGGYVEECEDASGSREDAAGDSCETEPELRVLYLCIAAI